MRLKHRVKLLITRLKNWLIKKLGGRTIETRYKTEFKWLHSEPIRLKTGAEYDMTDFIALGWSERQLKLALLEPMVDAIMDQMCIERTDDPYSHLVRFRATLLVVPKQDAQKMIFPLWRTE